MGHWGLRRGGWVESDSGAKAGRVDRQAWQSSRAGRLVRAGIEAALKLPGGSVYTCSARAVLRRVCFLAGWNTSSVQKMQNAVILKLMG